MIVKRWKLSLTLLMIMISGILFFRLLNIESSLPEKFETISNTELITRIENKENLIIYYSSRECSACKIFEPILAKAVQNTGVTIYCSMDEDNEQFADDYNIHVTPTLLFFKNGGVTRYEGTRDLSETMELLNVWKNN